jgi:Rrf2 family protein
MLTKTTVSAIRALMHLGLDPSSEPISPRRIAEALGESPTYLAKVMRLLVKAGVLRAHFGVAGGVVFNRKPEDITLLAITEACQGALLANLCSETDDLSAACAFHRAGTELHATMLGVMTRWTLADFLKNPGPSAQCDDQIRCWMRAGHTQLPMLQLSGGTGEQPRKAGRGGYRPPRGSSRKRGEG